MYAEIANAIMRKDIINTSPHVSRLAQQNSAMCQNSQISLSLLNRPLLALQASADPKEPKSAQVVQ